MVQLKEFPEYHLIFVEELNKRMPTNFIIQSWVGFKSYG